MQTDYSKESEIVLHKDYFCGYFECLVQHLFGRIDHHHLRLLLKITEHDLLCILLIFPRQAEDCTIDYFEGTAIITINYTTTDIVFKWTEKLHSRIHLCLSRSY